ncbi:MAG: diguanylate cyclase [Sphingomonadales bacterium]|nr:MAG: diguanylate cyclase [Sphingomonadales bacterium]
MCRCSCTFESLVVHIVLVDASRTTLRILEATIKDLGYGEAQCFQSAVSAWAHILKSDRVDLVVTGLEFPGNVSGLELCWNLRSHERSKMAHVLVLTSRDDTDTYIEALDSGADDFIVKPLRREILWAKLRAASRLLRMQDDLNHLANHDPLTGVYNRRAFSVAAELAINHADEEAQPLSMLLLDIDHFKSINDNYGHDVGDQAIRALAATVRAVAPKNAVIGRLGGEEFAVLLPDTTLVQGECIAEGVRASIEKIRLQVPNGDRGFTASIGVSNLTPTDSVATLLKRADDALYAAKNDGRNCVKSAAVAA